MSKDNQYVMKPNKNKQDILSLFFVLQSPFYMPLHTIANLLTDT